MQQIIIDFTHHSPIAVTQATQGDAMSRKVQVTLLDGSAAYVPPPGAGLSVRYKTPAGSDWYSTIDGRAAVTLEGNAATVELAPDMLTVPGHGVWALLVQGTNGYHLQSEQIGIDIGADPAPDTEQIAAGKLSVLDDVAARALTSAQSAAASAAAARQTVQDAAQEAIVAAATSAQSAAASAAAAQASANSLTKAALVNMLYPVGAIYISTVRTSPATLFGGTWAALGGRMLLGADSTYPAGSTGGEATHTLTLDEMAVHGHGLDGYTVKWGSQWGANGSGFTMVSTPMVTGNPTTNNNPYITSDSTATSGNGQPHNNLPPYLAVYMWKRTA